MGSIFSLDGPFVKYASLVADIIIISLLFMLTSIPIVTIGPSTTAIFYVMTKRIYEKEGYLLKDYFKSFKENFFQSLIIGVLDFTLKLVLIFNIYLIFKGIVFPLSTIQGKVFCVIYLFLLIEVFIISLYVYPLLARFKMKTKEIFKTSFVLAHKHMPTTISLVGIRFVIIFIVYKYPLFIIAAYGTYAAIASYFIMRIFKKYSPNIDVYLDELSYEERNKINDFYEQRKDTK